jgi:tetratricopeptide (TPR) repeat protein
VASDSPRIAELRRRVHADPASIAFAQLAEEYRRAGQYDEAVKYCRSGLARHPGYLSARVTLGRALVEVGLLDEAADEFALVLDTAPDNLAAIRGLAEIHQQRGDLSAALEFYQRALLLARFDSDLEETVSRIGRELGSVNSGSGQDTVAVSDDTTSSNDAAAVDAASPPKATRPAPLTDLIDFDAILESLGVPDATPPPVMEMLLAKASASSAPILVTPATRTEEVPDEAERAVIDELESWLRVLDHAEPRAPQP